MSESGAFRYIRPTATVLSLVNALAVFVEKLWVGGSKAAPLLDDPSIRVRLWATILLLIGAGLYTLVRALKNHMDLFADLEEGRPTTLIEMIIGMTLLTIGVGGGVTLVVLS